MVKRAGGAASGSGSVEGVVRAAVYRRISFDPSGEGMGVERQLELGLKLAEARQWRVSVPAEETCDNSLSAFQAGVERPGFERLLVLIAAGQVNAIVAQAMDRLCANQRDGVRLLELCKKHRVRLAFLNGGDLDISSPMGEFIANMMILIAQLERGTKGARQKVANRQRAEMGVLKASGTRPFGWGKDRRTPDPDEAPYVTAAFAAVMGGASLRSIAAGWNEAGVPIPQGRKHSGAPVPAGWRETSVRAVLLNPLHAGMVAHGGELVADIAFYSRGKQGLEPYEDPTRLVDKDTFLAVRDTLTARTPKPRSVRGVKSLIGGWALCACGGVVTKAVDDHGRGLYRHNRTPGYDTAPTTNSGTTSSGATTGGVKVAHVSRLGDPIDAYIESLVMARVSAPDAAETLLGDDPDGPDLSGLRQQREALLRQGEQAAADLINTGTDGGVSELKRRQLDAITNKVEAEVAEIDAELAAHTRVSVLAPLVNSSDPSQVWDGMHNDQRRAAVRELFAWIQLLPSKRGRGAQPVTETITYEWAVPPADDGAYPVAE